MVINVKILDDLARKIAESMPPAVNDLQRDVEKNVHAALQSAFAKLNLVTREEFDVQCKVLARTREQVSELEKRVAALENELLSARRPNPSREDGSG